MPRRTKTADVILAKLQRLACTFRMDQSTSELMCRHTDLYYPNHKRVNAAEVGVFARFVEGETERVVLVQRLRLELLLLGGDCMGFIVVVDPGHRRSHRHRHLGRHALEVLYGHLHWTCISAEAERRRDEEDQPRRACEIPCGELALGVASSPCTLSDHCHCLPAARALVDRLRHLVPAMSL